MRLELAERTFFVRAHQLTIACYIPREDRSKPPVNPIFGHARPPL
jgi:hypothetical protein